MVVFMVKWAFAAIPAALLLVAIVMGSMAIMSTVIESIERIKIRPDLVAHIPTKSDSEYKAQTSPTPQRAGFASDVPERCKGSVELEKCVEFEKRFSRESEEQKVNRRHALEAERQTNLEAAARQ